MAGKPSQDTFTTRIATLNDIEAICKLNKIAYPTLREEEIVWTPKEVRSHIEVFPEGQLVVEEAGQIIATASSLIVDFGRDPYRDHTWLGITDSGMFYNHNPYGTSLYGADVCVHPDHRRRGIASLLYDERRKLCQKLNLKRIVLGGRLYDYDEYAEQMSAEEYARKVESEELRDTVLSFQLAQGFVLRKVMPNYLPDPQSHDHATFLEWINPKYRKRKRSLQSVRISCVQYGMRRISNFDEFANQVEYFVDVAADYESDFVLFPELLTAQLMSFLEVKTPQEAIRKLTGFTDQVDELFLDLANHYQINIIGGTHPIAYGERIENVATLYTPEGECFRQSKLHVTPNEHKWWGISGGNTLDVFQTNAAKVGILICYDSEFPEAARHLAEEGAEIIFVPFCTDDRQAYLRVRYCSQARAVENQVYMALAGTVGNLPQVSNMDIQYAQSAVFSPSDFLFSRDGIVVEASANTETVITSDIDLEALREAINEGSVRQRNDRRRDLFEFRSNLGKQVEEQ